jgi:hypothetical protein
MAPKKIAASDLGGGNDLNSRLLFAIRIPTTWSNRHSSEVKAAE